jgi:RHS repeat-associated protein
VGKGQLNDLQALRNFTEQYHYDPVGNFEKMIHQAANGGWTRAYSYKENSLIETPKKSNRLSSTTLQPAGLPPVETYAYDAHGNMIKMPHLPKMIWDFEDQLSASSRQVVNGGTPESTYYAYDAGGQRVRKITETQAGERKNERIYLGGFEVFREYRNGKVNLARETMHIMDDKQRIALVETKTIENGNPINNPAPVHRYQFGNHLGSASLEFDESCGLISYEEYSPYGTTAFQAGRSAAEVSLKRYRYTGKERDEETGFTYHGARYYSPWLGMWVNTDPGQLIDGINLYTYAQTNPVIYHDPTGLVTQGEDGNWKPTSDSRKYFRSQGNQRLLTVDRWKTGKHILGEQETKLRSPGKPKLHPQNGNYKNVTRGRKRTPSNLTNPTGIEFGHRFGLGHDKAGNKGGAPRLETMQDNANKNQIEHGRPSVENVLPLPRVATDQTSKPLVNVPPQQDSKPLVNVPPEPKNTPLIRSNPSGLTPEQIENIRQLDPPIVSDTKPLERPLEVAAAVAIGVILAIWALSTGQVGGSLPKFSPAGVPLGIGGAHEGA